ncbi:MAG: sulfur carrier protein ThiS [Planctomycetota bacterium]
MPTIRLNGESRVLPEGTTVAALLSELGLDRGPVAVEINRKILPKTRYDSQALGDSDRVEIVTVVGGG